MNKKIILTLSIFLSNYSYSLQAAENEKNIKMATSDPLHRSWLSAEVFSSFGAGFLDGTLKGIFILMAQQGGIESLDRQKSTLVLIDPKTWKEPTLNLSTKFVASMLAKNMRKQLISLNELQDSETLLSPLNKNIAKNIASSTGLSAETVAFLQKNSYGMSKIPLIGIPLASIGLINQLSTQNQTAYYLGNFIGSGLLQSCRIQLWNDANCTMYARDPEKKHVFQINLFP